MRAVLFEKTGPSSVLEVKDVPEPTLNPTEVIIKTEYAGINFIDIYFRIGLYPAEYPYITGREAGGVITQLGNSVPSSLGLKVGDRIATWGNHCMAEYVALPANRVIKLPDHVSTRQGAALVLQGLTALTLLRDAHETKAGDWILVPAAAGGTGGMIVQIAKHLGATVIGTSSSDEKLETAKKHGCDHVINYTKQSVKDEVLKLTNGRGVDAVISGIGKATFDEELECVKRKGSMVSYGNASGAIANFSPLLLGKKNVRLSRPRMDAYLVEDEEFEVRSKELMDLVEKGVVKVEFGGEYSLEEVGKAHDDLASKKTTGKLIVKVA